MSLTLRPGPRLAALLLAVPIIQAHAQRPAEGKASVQRAMDEGWGRALDAAKHADGAALAALYAENGTIVDPGMPTVAGKANIAKVYGGMFATVKFLDMTHQRASLDIAGDLAVETGTFTQTLQEHGGPPHQVMGRYTIVWKKVGGRWLVLRDVDTPMPAEPASALEGTWDYAAPLKGQAALADGRFVFLYGPADGSAPMTSDAGTYSITRDTVAATITYSSDPTRVGMAPHWTIESWSADTAAYVVWNDAGQVTRGRAVKRGGQRP